MENTAHKDRHRIATKGVLCQPLSSEVRRVGSSGPGSVDPDSRICLWVFPPWDFYPKDTRGTYDAQKVGLDE